MTVSKKQQEAVNKYIKGNYYRPSIVIPKDDEDKIRVHAEQQGESVNAFINRAIVETMERDNQK